MRTGICTNRVPDHTDFTNCGAATLPGNRYCTKCRIERLNELSRRVRIAQLTLDKAQLDYAQLLAEGHVTGGAAFKS